MKVSKKVPSKQKINQRKKLKILENLNSFQGKIVQNLFDLWIVNLFVVLDRKARILTDIELTLKFLLLYVYQKSFRRIWNRKVMNFF